MVIQALADGTMNGKKHSDEEIGELKDSPKWNRRYYAFLRKLSTPFEVARIEMQKWWNRNKVEGGSGRLHNGYSVFLPGARDAFRNGLETVKHVPDASPDMYKKIEATPFSKHGLCKWIAEKGESSLEKFHHLLAHFANMGMRRILSDSLGLRGTARYNLKLDWKWTAISERPKENGFLLSCFRDIPCFYDHSALAVINARARRCGSMRDRHTGLNVLPKDNGEEFFSEYLLAQRERNKVFGQHATNSRCQCNKCAANPVPLPHIQDGLPHIQEGTEHDAATVESEEESFGVAEGFDFDLDATPPATVASDPTSLENFRRHQELNRIPIIPRQIFPPPFFGMPTAAPIPVFQHAPAQNIFAFPYHYVPAPAAMFPKEPPKKRKYKIRETEFKCLCEKQRFLSRTSGPTIHSTACKMK
jgi:hypothetical protein